MTPERGEAGVVRCGWERERQGVRAWVTGDPTLSVQGRTFAQADEKLWAEILRRTGDGENYREYDPPAPVDEALRAFLEPAPDARVRRWSR